MIVRTAVGERLFESAKKANVIEASPVDRSRPDFAPLIRLATKKKLQNNAYYIRRNLDNGRSEWLKQNR